MPSAAPCMSASYVKPSHFAVCSSVPRASVSLPLQNAMFSSSMAARNSSSRANGAVSRRKRRGCGFRRFVRQIDPVFTRLDHGALGVFVPRHFPPFLCDFRRLSFSPFEGLGRSQRTLNSLPESRAVARSLENAEAVGEERLCEVVKHVNDLRPVSSCHTSGKGMFSSGIQPSEALTAPDGP